MNGEPCPPPPPRDNALLVVRQRGRRSNDFSLIGVFVNAALILATNWLIFIAHFANHLLLLRLISNSIISNCYYSLLVNRKAFLIVTCTRAILYFILFYFIYFFII